MTQVIDTPIQYLKGVGPFNARILCRKGILTIDHLLNCYPQCYIDHRNKRNIASLLEDDYVNLAVSLTRIQEFLLSSSEIKSLKNLLHEQNNQSGHISRPFYFRKTVYQLNISDQSGQMSCLFIQSPFRGFFDQIKNHSEQHQLRIQGIVKFWRGELVFIQPQVFFNFSGQESIEAVYKGFDSLSPFRLKEWIKGALLNTQIQEFLPIWMIQDGELLSYSLALKEIHQPDYQLTNYEQLKGFNTAAYQRLQFHEVLKQKLWEYFPQYKRYERILPWDSSPEIILKAHKAALRILELDPQLIKQEHQDFKNFLFKRELEFRSLETLL